MVELSDKLKDILLGYPEDVYSFSVTSNIVTGYECVNNIILPHKFTFSSKNRLGFYYEGKKEEGAYPPFLSEFNPIAILLESLDSFGPLDTRYCNVLAKMHPSGRLDLCLNYVKGVKLSSPVHFTFQPNSTVQDVKGLCWVVSEICSNPTSPVGGNYGVDIPEFTYKAQSVRIPEQEFKLPSGVIGKFWCSQVNHVNNWQGSLKQWYDWEDISYKEMDSYSKIEPYSDVIQKSLFSLYWRDFKSLIVA